MSTLTAPFPIETIAPDCDRVVVRNVPWEIYARMRDDDANRHLRMSYYKGTLELMSPNTAMRNPPLGSASW